MNALNITDLQQSFELYTRNFYKDNVNLNFPWYKKFLSGTGKPFLSEKSFDIQNNEAKRLLINSIYDLLIDLKNSNKILSYRFSYDIAFFEEDKFYILRRIIDDVNNFFEPFVKDQKLIDTVTFYESPLSSEIKIYINFPLTQTFLDNTKASDLKDLKKFNEYFEYIFYDLLNEQRLSQELYFQYLESIIISFIVFFISQAMTVDIIKFIIYILSNEYENSKINNLKFSIFQINFLQELNDLFNSNFNSNIFFQNNYLFEKKFKERLMINFTDFLNILDFEKIILETQINKKLNKKTLENISKTIFKKLYIDINQNFFVEINLDLSKLFFQQNKRIKFTKKKI